jgi:hypothetical protein
MSSDLLPSISASLPGFYPQELEGGGIVLRGWFDPRDPRQYTVTSGRVRSWRSQSRPPMARHSERG